MPDGLGIRVSAQGLLRGHLTIVYRAVSLTPFVELNGEHGSDIGDPRPVAGLDTRGDTPVMKALTAPSSR